MSSIEIRPLAPHDEAAWTALWTGYQQFYRVDIAGAVSALTWRRLLDAQEPLYGALAWSGPQAVGMVHWVFHRTTWSVGDDCYLQDLFVAEAWRGSGIGWRLIEHVVERAAAAGCPSVYWLTHESNAIAQRLYARVAERSGFIQYCRPL